MAISARAASTRGIQTRWSLGDTRYQSLPFTSTVGTVLFLQNDFCVHFLGIVVTFSFVPLAGVENVQSITLWNFAENKVESVQAHGCHLSDLDGCLATGLLASASHDGCVKVWR